jgi:tetratricopeptide (TPR) repeat protein
MNVEREREAYDAIQNAKTRRQHASAEERDLIDAFAVRYAEQPTSAGRRPLDSLYAKAIGELSQRYPDDLDISTLHGEALMLLRPRRGSVDLQDPAVKEILPILEGVLARDIKHPLACHLYIHLVEASPEPGRAEACSDYLGDAIPGASHIRHMPSHIYMNIGRYGDGVRANQNAWHVDQQAAFGGPPGIYPSHNLHMMLFGAVLDGQSAVAIQAAKDLAKISRTSSFYHPVTLAIFGRWDEVLAMHEVPDDPFLEGMWRFARGMSHLRKDDLVNAKADLEHLTQIIAERPDSARFRFHSQPVLLGVPAGILAGEIAAAEGRWNDAVSLLEHAVTVEDGLVYDEPEPWHLPARHALGAVLLEMDRGADAERVYREALEDHPNSGWSLFGLVQALEAQGKDAEAVRRDFERSWARRDIWLRSSRF